MYGTLSKFFLFSLLVLLGLALGTVVSTKTSAQAQGLVRPPVVPAQPISTNQLPSLLFNGGAFSVDHRTASEVEASVPQVTYSMGGIVEAIPLSPPSSFLGSQQANTLKLGLGILSAALCALGIGLGVTSFADTGANHAGNALTGNALAGNALAGNDMTEADPATGGQSSAKIALATFFIAGGLAAPLLILTVATLSNLF